MRSSQSKCDVVSLWMVDIGSDKKRKMLTVSSTIL